MTSTREEAGIAGFSLKTFLVTAIGILLFGVYIGILMYGDNSIIVLNRLIDKEQSLEEEKKKLKVENQRLQKEYFELK